MPFEDLTDDDRTGVTASHPVRPPLIRPAPPAGAYYRMGQGTTYQRGSRRVIAVRRAALIGGILLALAVAAIAALVTRHS